ncbi:MAG: type II toxin-antitoxin system RelE/ParE family toxin [Byssovorax sp.]
MKRRLIVGVSAEEELGEASDWYEGKRPGLGIEFVDAVQVALDAILEAPETWRFWRKGHPYRKHVLHRFPFVLFFVVDEATIRIVAIAHAKRRPGYWLGR